MLEAFGAARESSLGGQRLFFATREDLRPGLEAIESEWTLEYLLHELRDDD